MVKECNSCDVGVRGQEEITSEVERLSQFGMVNLDKLMVQVGERYLMIDVFMFVLNFEMLT